MELETKSRNEMEGLFAWVFLRLDREKTSMTNHPHDSARKIKKWKLLEQPRHKPF